MNAAFEKQFKEIQAAEAKLQARKDTFRRDAIKEINAVIAMFGIRASELAFKNGDAAGAKNAAGSQKSKGQRRAAEPKYQAPDGTTWSGRGRVKKSIQAALDSGMTLEDMLIRK